MPVHNVGWKQRAGPRGDAPDSWEFQYSIDTYRWEGIPVLGNAVPCEDCWETDVETPNYDGYVRVRGIWPGGFESSWSDPLTVPEPGFGVCLGVGIALLLWVWSGRGRKKLTVAGVA